MKPDYNRYGEAPRAWKEIGSLRNYNVDHDNLKKKQNNRFNDQNNSSDVHDAF